MFLLSLISIGYAMTCLEALESEGKSLLQLIVNDKTNIKEQTIAIQQLMFSGKDINDLGHWASCIDLQDSSYFIIEVKSSSIPLMMGICVPSVCTEDDLSKFFTPRLSNALPNYFKDSFMGINPLQLSSIDIAIFPPKIYPLGTGGIITLLCCAILIVVIVAGTYFDYTLQKKLEKHGKLESIELSDKTSINTTEILQQPKRSPKYVTYLLCFSIIKN